MRESSSKRNEGTEETTKRLDHPLRQKKKRKSGTEKGRCKGKTKGVAERD